MNLYSLLDMATSILPEQLPTSLMPIDTAHGRPHLPTSSGKQHPNRQQQQDNYDDSPNPASDDEFHVNIPAFLTQHGRSLAQMDQNALAECLQPVMKSLRKLNAESLLQLEQVQNGARLRDGVNVRPIHDEVYPQYESGGGISCVRYIHITEVPEQYSIGIFVFPPFARIPLHDHPEMCVLSRLLYGDLQCLSLDLPDSTDAAAAQPDHRVIQHPPRGATPQHHYLAPPPPGLPEGSRRAFKNPVKHLHAPDVSLLFPFKGNLHEFFAGPNGAAVLDILLPPYDCEHDRDCTFYDVQEDTPATPSVVASQPLQDDAMEEDDLDERTPCWIVPTGQPHDFHCLSGKYQKLGAHILSMQDI